MANNQVQSACVWGWPAGYARLLTPGGEYAGQANGGGRVDLDVSTAPDSFWTALQPASLELPGVSYLIEMQLNDSVRQAALHRAQAPELELVNSDKESRGHIFQTYREVNFAGIL